jgi:recombinational DNA repair protein (RecF pathway)
LKCLGELGYYPQLGECVVTGGKLSEDFVAWSSALGGIVCESGYRQAVGEAWRLQHPRAVVALRQFLKPAFVAERLAMPPEVQDETVRIIYEYLQYQIGKPLRSLG